MALVSVRSRALVLLSWIIFIIVPPLFIVLFFCVVFDPCFVVQYLSLVSSFAIISLGREIWLLKITSLAV